MAVISWQCPTCAVPVASEFCPGCGEHRLQDDELTLRGLLREMASALSHADSRLFRSLRALVLHPGRLTQAYQEGRRKPYFAPFPLFLVLNLAFFAVQSLTRFRVFSSQLDQHLTHQDWSELANRLVTARLAAHHLSLDAYRPVFDQAVALNAKSLIGLMVLPLTLALSVIFARSRQPLAVHAVFALHFYGFLLILISLPVLAMAIRLLAGGDVTLSDRADLVASLALLAICSAYLYVASGRVYGARGWSRALQTALLAASGAAIFVLYRFVLFLITLYTT